MSISITTHLNQEKMHTKTFHRRHDSGELDVFEAAGYFSGYNEVSTGTTFPQKSTTRGGRLSLDMPSTRNAAQIQPNNHALVLVDKAQVHVKEISSKKYKQPSSPGGKLASFLNSLFNQNASKKKKPKSIVAAKSLKDHPIINNINNHGDDDDDLRKKRRSSISHFPISSSSSFNTTTTTTTTNTNDSSRSFYYSSSSSAGFRPSSPPIYANTPAKGHVKDLRGYSKKSNNVSLDCDDKFKFGNTISNSSILETSGKALQNQNLRVIDKCSSDQDHQKEYKVFPSKINGCDDDGAESDSSSDLFELQNCEVGSFFPSGNLPVYETTKLDHLKRPISNDTVV